MNPNEKLNQLFKGKYIRAILECLISICLFYHLATSTPSLKDLFELITPQYATKWREIGIVLGLRIEKINIIQANWPHNIEQCCNRMLETWRETDLSASWEKLFSAITSPAVCNQSGNYNVKYY